MASLPFISCLRMERLFTGGERRNNVRGLAITARQYGDGARLGQAMKQMPQPVQPAPRYIAVRYGVIQVVIQAVTLGGQASTHRPQPLHRPHPRASRPRSCLIASLIRCSFRLFAHQA